MDDTLRELERVARARPEDLDALRRLATAARRAGWRHEGRSLDALLAEQVHVDRWDEQALDSTSLFARTGLLAVADLVDALASPAPSCRWRATLALAQVGRHAVAAVEPLLDRLQDHELLVRDGARWALRALLPAALPAIVARYRASEDARPELARLLEFLGMGALPAASVLQEPGLHRTEPLRALARLALGSITGASVGTPDLVFSEPQLQWTFVGARHTDRARFEHEVRVEQHLSLDARGWDGDHDDLPTARWQPDRIVLGCGAVRIRFCIDWPAEPEALLESRAGQRFTAGDLLLELTNALAPHYTGGDRWFAGLRLIEPASAARPPLYEVGIDT